MRAWARRFSVHLPPTCAPRSSWVSCCGRMSGVPDSKDAVMLSMVRTRSAAALSDEQAAAAERELVRRCLNQDAAAWRALYDRHFGKVLRLVQALGLADTEADDLCQEIFLIIYRHLRSF